MLVGSRLGRNDRLDHGHEPSARWWTVWPSSRPAAHPRTLQKELPHPDQLRRSWYFFYFALPGLPEQHVRAGRFRFFRHFLRDARPPYTPEEMDRYVEAWSQPGAVTAMINYYRNSVRTPPKKAKAAIRRLLRPRSSSGGSVIASSAPSWPSPTTTTCPTSTVSSACPAHRIGSITTRRSASISFSSIFSGTDGASCTRRLSVRRFSANDRSASEAGSASGNSQKPRYA